MSREFMEEREGRALKTQEQYEHMAGDKECLADRRVSTHG